MLPAPKNSSGLKSEWLRVCSSAPAIAQSAKVSLPAVVPRKRGSEPDKYHPYILDARIGEQFFDPRSVSPQLYAPESRCGPYNKKYEPNGLEARFEVRDNTHHTIHPHFYHHPAHHRRDVGRGGGMRLRQPAGSGKIPAFMPNPNRKTRNTGTGFVTPERNMP